MAQGKKRSLQIDPADEKSSDARLKGAVSAANKDSASSPDPESGSDHDGESGDEPEEKESGGQKIPRCPNCGWRNVRLSHSNGPLDLLMKMFSVAPFRCRSCGKRFRRRWVVKDKDKEND